MASEEDYAGDDAGQLYFQGPTGVPNMEGGLISFIFCFEMSAAHLTFNMSRLYTVALTIAHYFKFELINKCNLLLENTKHIKVQGSFLSFSTWGGTNLWTQDASYTKK